MLHSNSANAPMIFAVICDCASLYTVHVMPSVTEHLAAFWHGFGRVITRSYRCANGTVCISETQMFCDDIGRVNLVASQSDWT